MWRRSFASGISGSKGSFPFASGFVQRGSSFLRSNAKLESTFAVMIRGSSRHFGTTRSTLILRERSLMTRSNFLLRQQNDKRGGSKKGDTKSEKNKNLSLILVSVVVGTVALSYLSVPLYRMFCQHTGYGGSVKTTVKPPKEQYVMRTDRPLTVNFSSSVNSAIPWKFYPVQQSVKLVPGQPVLIFYKAENPTDEDIVGIAAYNVTPAKAGVYFLKTECFCFEEQLLPAKSEVDLPVLFTIDPEFADDPHMTGVYTIVLNYTFFRSKDFEGLEESDTEMKRMD